MTRVFLALFLLGAAPLAAQQPSAAEVAFIYELNRARANPQAYDTANSLGGILNGVAAQPPLAINLDLCESARVHSVDMATNGYFNHTSPTLGAPNGMAITAGYPLPYASSGNNIESLACVFTPGGSISYVGADALKALIIDQGVSPPGHRYHLLAMQPFWETHREIGTGYAEGAAPQAGYNAGAYWSIHTAERTGTDPVWITGVVYNDANSNGRYDLGEGLSGVTVSAAGPGSPSVVTNAGGGYSLACSAGAWVVTCSGGAFSGTGTANVNLTTANVAVDFRSGVAQGDVGFVAGNPAPPGGGGGGGGDEKGGGGCATSPVGARWLWGLAPFSLVALVRRRWVFASVRDSG
ncbi:MAG: hypothetical protein IT464_05650 [Planctomycetes bacterium]|nr:hypothetical protein [Planctomycetota bacterium]